MNRAQRRAQAAKDRRLGGAERREKAAAMQFAADLAEADRTITGFTWIGPDGDMQFIDAAALRTGGHA
jgi:hypothetical protein